MKVLGIGSAATRLSMPRRPGSGGGSPPAQITDGAADYNGTLNSWAITFTDGEPGVTYTLKDSGATVATVVNGDAVSNSGAGAFVIPATLRIDATNANGTTQGANFSPTVYPQTGTANPMTDLFRVAGNLQYARPDTAGNDTWSTSGGTWTKANGEAAISGGSGHIWACYDAGISDCTIIANVHTAASGAYMPGIAFRCVGGLGWYFEVSDGGWYLNYQGSDPVANDPVWGAANDTAYELKVVLSGNDISLYIDGVQVGTTITDSRDAGSTTHGLHSYENDAGSNFHDISINA